MTETICLLVKDTMHAIIADSGIYSIFTS